MTRAPEPEDYLVALLDEIERADHLRELVAKSGYTKDTSAWVKRSKVTAAVAKLSDTDPRSQSLGAELRRFLLAEGWRERKYDGIWQWRARRVHG